MEPLLMSAKERARLELFGRVSAGDLTLVKASELLGLSYRQTKRSWSRFQDEGAGSLVHGLRGRSSNRRPAEDLKPRALELYVSQYSDYGPTLAAECLREEDGLEVGVETLRRWLISAGLWSRRRQRKQHRRRRVRKEQFGELVQLDGSHHDWFEGRRLAQLPASLREQAYAGWAVLMVMIDDATGRVFARFFENESLSSAWSTFRGWVQRQGIPRALYVDRHSIYRSDKAPTAEQLLAGEEPPTQFGRSMQELDVRLIKARSPQAKGRVERMNGTLQDRLVKALRRAGISDLEAANRFLEEEFLGPFNERFVVPASSSGDLHRALVASQDLDLIFSVQEERVVQNDWTVRWQNRFLQLSSSTAAQVQPGDSVTVCEQADGQLRLLRGESELSWSPTSGAAGEQRQRASKRPAEIGSSQGQRPSAEHPWRRFRFAGSQSPRPPELAGSAPSSLRSSCATPANSEVS